MTVQPGESLRLRYCILLRASPADGLPVDVAAAYEDYLGLAGS